MRNLALLPTHKPLSRTLKKLIVGVVDLLMFGISCNVALLLRFDHLSYLPRLVMYLDELTILIGVKLFVFYLFGMYDNVSRHTGMRSFAVAIRAIFASTAIAVVLSFFLGLSQLPRSVIVIDGSLTFLLVVASRLVAKSLLNEFSPLRVRRRQSEKIIIYGAGQAGSSFANGLTQNQQYKVVAFVDDNRHLQGQLINGIRVYSRQQLSKLIERFQVKTVLLAIPSLSRPQYRQILCYLKELPVTLKTVPSLDDVVSGKVSLSEIRNIDITDLLGREEILPNPQLLEINVRDKVVLVTGAGGSIGAELCRQLVRLQPACLALYELNEFALYGIHTELSENYPNLTIVPCLGSVTDAERFAEVVAHHQVQTIYHAAAYKHVPLVELNPEMGIINNALGTFITAQTAITHAVETFVLISTDKAVRPTNVMGASKRVAEMILQALAKEANIRTRLMMVRFGNVLDSTGSVIPRFRQQIAQGKPLTVTHPEITRYFMSIPEAARLVIQAGSLGQGGEVFLLDMGEPIKIADLARQMIELSGMVPEQDIEIRYTGLRPGEKLYEELLIDPGNTWVTDHPKIYGSYEAMLPWGELSLCLKALFIACHQRDRAAIYRLLQEIVPNYQPSPWLLTKGAEPNPASVEPAPVVPAGAASHRHKVAKPLSPAVQCIGI
jgi:FlaA1/EpsC-like NDP-sugar epimerase